MSVTLHVLLEAPYIECNVAYGSAEPPVSHQLGQVCVLQYFGGMASSMDHHMLAGEGFATVHNRNWINLLSNVVNFEDSDI